jgi:Uma2 family endonuclease
MATQLSLPYPYPDTKPATEFVGGQLVQKVSPRGLHARVQLRIGAILEAWAFESSAGRVGTEWDFDLSPPGESVNRLVPDIAFLSYQRVPRDDDAAADIPTVAPNVAVEILSPGQRMEHLAEKVRIYLATGCELVVVVDPRAEYAVLHDNSTVRRIEPHETIEHPALAGCTLALAAAFEKP